MIFHSTSVICSLHHVLIMVLLLLKFVSSGPAGADEERTYPEEVHQRVIDKLNKLHGKSTSEEGMWGTWSSWSPCSRSCGAGVTIQSRKCLPRSKRKRLRNSDDKVTFTCGGHNKRHQLCNTQMCPEGPIDSWTEQCSAYNRRPFNKKFYSWEPFIDSHESCALNCRAVGLNFYATLSQSVIDGTPCGASQPVDRIADRICVEGRCMKVGCDGLLGSLRQFDACGICGGDNSTCRLISGVYTRANLPFGYNLIATIPPHAVNLSFYHLKPSTNYLALREQGGSYLLNGPQGMNSSGNFSASGTTFTYARPHAFGGDRIYARGPTTHSVDVMLFYQNTNPGIRYEYRLPITRNFGSGNELPLHRVSPRYFQNNPSTGTLIPNYNEINSESAYAPSSLFRGGPYQNALAQSAYSYPSQPLADDPTRFKNPQGNTEQFDNRFSYTSFNSNPRGNSFQARIPFNPAANPQSNVSLSFVNSIYPINNPDQSLPHKFFTFPYPSRTANPTLAKNVLHPNKIRHENQVTPTLESVNNLKPSSKNIFFPPETDDLKHSNLPYNMHGLSWLDSYHSRSGILPGKSSSANKLPASLTSTYNHLQDSKLSNVYLDRSLNVLSDHTGFTTQKGPINDGQIINLSVDKLSSFTKEENKDKIKIDKELQKKLHTKYHNKDSKDSKKKKYVWLPKGFTRCSQSCGGGIQTTRHICVKKKHKDQEVPAYFCSDLETPFQETVRCNTMACPPQWETTDWGKCSVICGFGVQLRKLICKKRITPNEVIPVPDEECHGMIAPPISQVCQMRDCDGPPSWERGDWSPCSTPCGLGTRTRYVRCSTFNGVVDNSRCKPPIPTEEEMCDMGSCATDTWFFSPWDEECIGPCGEGVRRRRVHCSGNALSGTETPASCNKNPKPSQTKKCENKSECHGSWFAGPWSDCDVRCGTGSQRRGIICVIWQNGKYKVAKDPLECKSEGDRPPESRSCLMECKAEWFTSQWSECSQPCDGGVQRREVKCLNDRLQPATQCSEAEKPDTRQFCNTQSCNKELDNRIQNEIITSLQHLSNDSATSGKLIPKPLGKPSYEYHEHGPTLYIKGQPQNNSPTQVEPSVDFRGHAPTMQSNRKYSADGTERKLNHAVTNNLGIRSHDDARRTSESIADSTDSRILKTTEENQQKSESKDLFTVSPGTPWKPGMCMDRMKNCNLVFKARLCKLRYYNKLCCETCSKH